MKKIKAVIFDLDGTIANTLPLCITAFRKSIEPLINRSLSDEEIIATFGPSEEGTIMTLAPQHYEKGVSSYLKFYKELHTMCPAPFDGIEDLLITLKEKSVKIAMVTGKGRQSTDISLERFGIGKYFEAIETGISTGPRKAEGIQNVIELFKDIGKEEIIYVGDAPGDITRCPTCPTVLTVLATHVDATGLALSNSEKVLFFTSLKHHTVSKLNLP